MSADSPTLRRDGDTLAFSGTLLREDVAGLWPQASKSLDGVRRFDLGTVARIDSAGLALLSALAARAAGAIDIAGDPVGLASLRAAYRLTPALAFEENR